MEGKSAQRSLTPLSPGWIALLVLTITVLAAIVAAASRAAGPNPSAAPLAGSYLGPAVLRALLILLVIAEAAVVALLVWALWPANGRPRLIRTREGRWAIALATFVQVAVAILVLWAYIHVRSQLRGTPFAGGLGGLLSNPSAAVPASARGLPAGGEWLTSLLVAAALGAIAVWLIRGTRLGGHRRAPLATLANELRAGAEEGLEELEAEPDPRRAVIAAYSRMLLALERSGLPRAPHETAPEFLARALDLAAVARAPALVLTDLFHLARFSQHPIDGAMKARAIAALVHIRADLAPAAGEELRLRSAAE